MRGEKSQRAWIYAIVGAYLLYTAWQLFQGLGDSEESQVLFAVFAVFFAVVGVVLIWFAIRSMKKGNAQEDRAQENSAQEDNARADGVQAENPLADSIITGTEEVPEGTDQSGVESDQTENAVSDD
ncbi:MAG: hypothetical protein LUI14_16835 [Lachnospiraceae bacterium]|nr:hypothetical protein [Lachnospiraceae bacterium]